jgi:phenylpyruvate tautomerase PptA (4-oxalocrotonate tautomerase family)
MPIVTLDLPPLALRPCPSTPTESGALSRLIYEVRDAGARALGCPPGNVWVSAESRAARDPAYPPVIRVLASPGRSQEVREAFAAAVTEAVARSLGVAPAGVWLHYEEMRS